MHTRFGEWACRTGYDNLVAKTYTVTTGGLEERSAWAPEDGPIAGAAGETYGTNGTNLIASTRFRGGNGVQFVGDYASSEWQGDTLRFDGAIAGNIGRGLQSMVYTRIDDKTFERRFLTGTPPVMSSVERCVRGRTAPTVAPTMQPG